MAQPNATFDEILSSTTYKYLSEGRFRDNIFTGAHFLSLYKQYGGIQEVDGGKSLVVQLQYAINPTVRSSNPWDELTFQQVDEFTSAEYTWKQIDGTTSISRMDMAQNSGESKIADLQKSKLGSLESTIRQNFNSQLFNGTTADSKNINGVLQLVSSSGTIGGIDSSAQSWWRSSVLSSGVALDTVMMDTQYHNCFYDEAPQVIVTTQALFEKYADLTRKTIVTEMPNAKIAELGFDNLTFKGKPIVWDRDCIASHMYFLNFNALKLCPHRDFNFRVSPAIELQKQHVLGFTVLWIGNHIINSRRLCSRGQLWTA